MMMNNKQPPNIILDYFRDVQEILQHKIDVISIAAALTTIQDALKNGRQIFIIGNGGSCATAEHIALDLSKSVKGYNKVYSLSSPAALTAWANDTDYTEVYAKQLKNYSNFGDLLICISTSGNSENIIKAADYGQHHNLEVIGLTAFDGGRLRQLLDIEIYVPTKIIEIAEDIHLSILHNIIYQLKKGNKAVYHG